MERRNFIKSAASLSAVTMLSPDAVFASGNKPAIHLGFIGFGGSGRINTLNEITYSFSFSIS